MDLRSDAKDETKKEICIGIDSRSDAKDQTKYRIRICSRTQRVMRNTRRNGKYA